MTIKTWQDEYLDPMDEDMTDLEAVTHSLKKWQGLRHENLKKHDLFWAQHFSALLCRSDEGIRFDLDGSSCALCSKHEGWDEESDRYCVTCPLALVRDGVACDDLRGDETTSPWHIKDEKPEVMITWLEKARELVNEEQEQ